MRFIHFLALLAVGSFENLGVKAVPIGDVQEETGLLDTYPIPDSYYEQWNLSKSDHGLEARQQGTNGLWFTAGSRAACQNPITSAWVTPGNCFIFGSTTAVRSVTALAGRQLQSVAVGAQFRELVSGYWREYVLEANAEICVSLGVALYEACVFSAI